MLSYNRVSVREIRRSVEQSTPVEENAWPVAVEVKDAVRWVGRSAG